MTNARYTDLQLDALRELANIGSGTAGTALSSLLGSPIELSVPSASAVLLSACPMRLIRLVITPLHPRDQLQHLFNRIQAQR